MRSVRKRPCAIVWFRQDLRLGDNPALRAAVERGLTVIPLYVWAPEEEGDWAPGGASRWWLHHSLAALDAHLRAGGSRLILRQGPSLAALPAIARSTGAIAVFWNRRYEPDIRDRDASVQEALRRNGIEAESFNGSLLREPWAIRNRSGKPFQVFTPFWRHCLALPDPPEPLPAPRTLPSPRTWPASVALSALSLEPKLNWAAGLRAAWRPGEAGAAAHLSQFLRGGFASYADDRDRPGLAGTSRLSPHLHFGEISPRQIWHALKRRTEGAQGSSAPRLASSTLAVNGWRSCRFVAELGWREFSHHLLYHFPHTVAQPLRSEFGRFRWRSNPAWLRAWQRGQTGYPLVDAGMRELWATGWMHNRVRMVVASFLVKDLLVSWLEGARWFWDTLVDADLAQNTLGWQWTAGCGADAAPFFRIFNPSSQGKKFDPEGAYVRRWVPELAALPAEWIHEPHTAPPEALARAGVSLGKDYPAPIVSHTIAREVALEAYARIRS